MQNLRRWEVDRSTPFVVNLAADARFSRTDYTDDQVWKLRLGEIDNPALALQTQFGGRAGLVSIVPMWILEGRTVYQFQTYSKPPIFTHTAPSYARVEAQLVPELDLVAEYWAMESRATGGRFTVTNTSDEPVNLRLDLFGHVIINSLERKLNVLTFRDDSIALHFGTIGNIDPVLVLEGSTLEIYGGFASSPKIGCKVVIPAGESVKIPFVCAGLGDMRDSLGLAMNWLAHNMDPYLEQIDLEARAIPKIYTGDDKWDRLLDLSFNEMVNAFMKPTSNLPYASFVANRATDRGFSKRGDGGDHIRSWAGQDPIIAYTITSMMASIEPDFAKGIILNYLATQDDSGLVDRQPGLGGQRQGMMSMPILARMAWQVYEQIEDAEFLKSTFPKLLMFFNRWFNHDFDVDGDGIPEWQSERQMGYVAFPTFAAGQPWGQGADVSRMETPDLLAYLISEADALHTIAETLGEEKAVQTLSDVLDELKENLETFWDGTRYTYRDRDSHITADSVNVLNGGAGDEEHFVGTPLLAPNRVIIRIVGGVSHRPRIKMKITGRDKDGNPSTVTAESDDFLWLNRQGMHTTKQAFSHIDSIKIDGLSRVYKIYADTVDSNRLDINHLLPLWTGLLPAKNAQSLLKLASDKNLFMRPNGITMVSAQDSRFDPSNARGGGGMWMYWLSLIGEGMVKSGFKKEAVKLIKTVLDALSAIHAQTGHFSQFYHSDEPQAFGEEGHIGGLVPVNLLMDILGIRIVSKRKVMVGGEFVWGRNVSVEQHGVTVKRGKKDITITFPSGNVVELPAEADWQAVVDTVEIEEEPIEELEIPEISTTESANRVIIEVDEDEAKPKTVIEAISETKTVDADSSDAIPDDGDESDPS